MGIAEKKKFGLFIKALKGQAGGTQPKLVDELFKIFDISIIGLEGLLKNWMAGRNQGYKEEFRGKNLIRSTMIVSLDSWMKK